MKFSDYKKEDYIRENILFIEPMLAKEEEDLEKQEILFNSPNHIIENKLDGTRATLHFTPKGVRVFSRRISKKTNWFNENSDSVPHLRDIIIPELFGTIIDGEMSIPNREFKDVSGTLNCKSKEAIERQEVLGKIQFNVFDIIYYKDVNIKAMQLHRRKHYLSRFMNILNKYKADTHIKEVYYCNCKNGSIPVEINKFNYKQVNSELYPSLYKEMKESVKERLSSKYYLSPKAYYEYILITGNEGVMIKPLDGIYHHNRGKEYTKIKKFLTKDVIIVNFGEPTDEYKGKFPTVDKWNYWETNEHDLIDLTDMNTEERYKFINNWSYDEIRPISKHYCNGWVGNIKFGVIINDEEIKQLPKGKDFEIVNMEIDLPPCNDIQVVKVLITGECSSFSEELREEFTLNSKKYIGSVIEVKANDMFKDTGRLRNPRFFRLRPDKNSYMCDYKDYMYNGYLKA